MTNKTTIFRKAKQMKPKLKEKCTCNFNDETATEIGHLLDCPMVNKDLRYKHMKQDSWKDKFREEFGIHFKGSKGELQFAEQFITDLLLQQRKEIINEVDDLIIEELLICRKEGQHTSRLTSLYMKLKQNNI